MSDPLKCLWLSHSTAYNWSCLLCFVPKIPLSLQICFQTARTLFTCKSDSPTENLSSPQPSGRTQITCTWFPAAQFVLEQKFFHVLCFCSTKEICHLVIFMVYFCCLFFFFWCVCCAVKMKIITYCFCTVWWSKGLCSAGLGNIFLS